VRILRIVTRLNTGGPARHLTALSQALDSDRYEQWLAAGREGAREGSMRSFVEGQGVRLTLVPEMVGTSRLGPADVWALARIRRMIRDVRPDIVETHTTKAGIVGRLAARLEGSPVVVHVYHGHVLEGHYGAVKTRLARCAERLLARASDRLLAVSARVKDDLVRLKVASPELLSAALFQSGRCGERACDSGMTSALLVNVFPENRRVVMSAPVKSSRIGGVRWLACWSSPCPSRPRSPRWPDSR